MRPNKIKPDPSTDKYKQNASSSKVSPFPDPASRNPPVTVPPSSRFPVLPDPSTARGPDFPGPSSARSPPFPGPSSARSPPFPDSSSARSPFPDSSSARSPFPDPSSARTPEFPDPSSARGPTFPDPPSTSGSAFPDHSAPKGSLFPDSTSPKPVQDSGFSLLSDSSKSLLSPVRSMSQFMDQSSESLRQSVSFAGPSFQKMPSKPTGSILKIRPGSTPAKQDDDGETPNWLCAAISLLPLCLLLLAMVCLLSVKVRALEEESEVRIDVMMLRVKILSETLKQLQMGKAWTCTMCPVQWVQRADLCFFFSELKMSWSSSRRSCMGKDSSLAIMETKEELHFLLNESRRYFLIRRGKEYYDRFWLGLVYTNSSSLTLADGTHLNVKLSPDAGPNPCIYLQRGRLLARPCYNAHHYICKGKVKFGWI